MSKFYLTGGMLRNKLLDAPVSPDYDFAVEASSYEDMKAELTRRGVFVWQERPEFVTVRGCAPFSKFGDFGGLLKLPGNPTEFPADFTLCRAETMYSDKRHPDKVTPTDLYTDLARRDFTVNALAVSESGEWHDPFGGTCDAETMTLRCVGEASLRFAEDPLRMLRALRFMVAYDLCADDNLHMALNDFGLVNGVTTLPKERVMDELNKAFKHDWPMTMKMLFMEYPTLGLVVSNMGLKLKATT